MSRVDLGFLENCENWQIESRLFPSKAGGKPAWLDLKNLPDINDLKCKKCGKVMIFLCQVYAPVEDDDNNFHRTLYVFVCRNSACSEINNSDNIKVFRNSLRRENPFYSFDPPVDEPDDSFINNWCKLCTLCGILADKHCSQCKIAAYCQREHQVLDWKDHKKDCNIKNSSKKISNILFTQYEIVMEPEAIKENEINEENELEKFQKLEAEGKTGTLKDISELELEAHATCGSDKSFTKFKKRISNNPDQILRYERNGTPLWIAAKPTPINIPDCEYCGAKRQFEFQIMPQMLSLLKENDLDWGVIVIYTCSNSCVNNVGYKQEYVFKQDVALNDV